MVNDTRNELAALDRHLHEGREQDPHLLREVMRLHQAMMAGFSRQTGMTATRFALMRLVARAGDAGIGVMDLARRLGVNAAAVTRQVQDMEQDGLIRRRPDAKDGRRSQVRLSAKGVATFATIHGRSHELEQALAAIVSPDEMRAAARTLATLRGAIERMMEGPR